MARFTFRVRHLQEQELGGVLRTEPDYRAPYLREQIEQRGWALWPPIPYAADTIDWSLPAPYPNPPSARHWLGTNGSSNDVLAILIYGFRLSILFGLALTAISSVIGITVGALQGYFGGWVDLAGQRVVRSGRDCPYCSCSSSSPACSSRTCFCCSASGGLQLDGTRRRGARRVSAGTQLRVRARRLVRWGSGMQRSSCATCCRTPPSRR